MNGRPSLALSQADGHCHLPPCPNPPREDWGKDTGLIWSNEFLHASESNDRHVFVFLVSFHVKNLRVT